jgi:DNA (cytosine-5)-methyltransferase 1
MLGQSISGQVIRAIANRIAYCFMKVKQNVIDKVEKVKHSYTIADSGQLELAI